MSVSGFGKVVIFIGGTPTTLEFIEGEDTGVVTVVVPYITGDGVGTVLMGVALPTRGVLATLVD